MSTVVILTPVLISSWPVIAAAASAAAAGLGLTVAKTVENIREVDRNLEAMNDNSVEIELDHSNTASNLSAGSEMVMEKDGMKIIIKRDNRGRCSVCAEGRGFSKAQLKHAAEEFTQKFTQCYAYHRTVTELKNKNFQMLSEEVEQDGSIKIHVRRWVD
jgi:ABC-type transporter MlaC component